MKFPQLLLFMTRFREVCRLPVRIQIITDMENIWLRSILLRILGVIVLENVCTITF